MNLGYMILYVPNVAQAVEFYEKAFSLQQKFMHESKQYAEMETGQTALAFASHEMLKENGSNIFVGELTRPSGFEIAFITDDVPTAYKNALEAGCSPMQEPTQKPWGQTVAFVRDLNGSLVELCTAIKK
jgi:lactoylglutathione lyase